MCQCIGYYCGKLRFESHRGDLRNYAEHVPEFSPLEVGILGYLPINSHPGSLRVAPGDIDSLALLASSKTKLGSCWPGGRRWQVFAVGGNQQVWEWRMPKDMGEAAPVSTTPTVTSLQLLPLHFMVRSQ